MTREEAQQILAMLRSEEGDETDPFFADALREVARDPELARWFAQEKEFDRAFAASLEMLPIPAGLRTRMTAAAIPPVKERRTPWLRNAALAAAALIILALLFGSLRGPGNSLDEFRGEMISFVKLTPPLELETPEIERIQNFLTRTEAPTPAASAIPSGLSALEAAGCRVLFFRGHKVTLICFKRGNGKLAHLLVVDRAALPRLPEKTGATFAPEGEWTTAAWQDGEHAYVLAAQGDRAVLEHYLNRS